MFTLWVLLFSKTAAHISLILLYLDVVRFLPVESLALTKYRISSTDDKRQPCPVSLGFLGEGFRTQQLHIMAPMQLLTVDRCWNTCCKLGGLY